MVMKKVAWKQKRWPLMAVSLLFLTGFCLLNPEAAPTQDPSKREATMNLDQKQTALQTIPPIDAAAPAEVATATFGMG